MRASYAGEPTENGVAGDAALRSECLNQLFGLGLDLGRTGLHPRGREQLVQNGPLLPMGIAMRPRKSVTNDHGRAIP